LNTDSDALLSICVRPFQFSVVDQSIVLYWLTDCPLKFI